MQKRPSTKIEPLLRASEVAELLSVRESTIRKWILLRRLRAVKIGASIRIPESEISRLVAAGERPRREVGHEQ